MAIVRHSTKSEAKSVIATLNAHPALASNPIVSRIFYQKRAYTPPTVQKPLPKAFLKNRLQQNRKLRSPSAELKLCIKHETGA
jgi:hypothetical protein